MAISRPLNIYRRRANLPDNSPSAVLNSVEGTTIVTRGAKCLAPPKTYSKAEISYSKILSRQHAYISAGVTKAFSITKPEFLSFNIPLRQTEQSVPEHFSRAAR